MSFHYRPTCEVLAQEAQAESDAKLEFVATLIFYGCAFCLGVLATLLVQAWI